MKTIESQYLDRSRESFYFWIKKNYSPKIAVKIQKVWIFMLIYQGRTQRRDGTAVSAHLEGTAKFLHVWGFNYKFIMAALLHDIIEDVPSITIDHLKKTFGKEVSDMVNFMSRNMVKYNYTYESKINRWLKIRPNFIFIRLADQFYNILNFEGYKNNNSLQKNCYEIIDMLDRADVIIQNRIELQNNCRLIDDLKTLRIMALSHLSD